MAIKMTVVKNVLGQEIMVPDAYHRAERFEGNKDKIVFTLVTYTSDFKHEVDTRMYHFTPSADVDAPRWDKQAYEYVKTLDEFANAIDC